MSVEAPRPDETGLEFLRRIYHPGEDGEPMAPIADLLGMTAISVEPGEVTFELTPDGKHYNPIGTVHGGVAATLIDSVMGSAVHTRLDAGVGYTTLDLTVHYVRAMTDRVGPVRATGRVVHLGRRVATAEGRVTDASGNLYAHGSCSCIVLSPK
jgi:uncharacterized protein (TIGR00369 family)